MWTDRKLHLIVEECSFMFILTNDFTKMNRCLCWTLIFYLFFWLTRIKTNSKKQPMFLVGTIIRKSVLDYMAHDAPTYNKASKRDIFFFCYFT